jgi:protein phosphatase
VLVVLVGGAFLARLWVFSHYYIGANQANDVVIFQGMPGDALGVSLSRQVEDSCQPAVPNCKRINIRDLQEAQRLDVRNGSTKANDLNGARQAMQRLRRTALLPVCQPPQPPAVPAQPTQPPAPGQPAAPAPQQPAAPVGQTPAPVTAAPGQPAPSSAPAPGPQPGQPAQATETSSPDGTPLQTEEQKPGVNCRKAS